MFSYYVKESSINSVTIYAPVGKKFSDGVRKAIVALLDGVSGISIVREASGPIKVIFSDYKGIDLIALIESIVPKEVANKSKVAIEKASKRNAARETVIKHQEASLSNESALKWVRMMFGAMNNHNTAAMIEFLTGNKMSFDGLLNRSASEAMVRHGFIIGTGMEAQYDFEAVKAHFMKSVTYIN